MLLQYSSMLGPTVFLYILLVVFISIIIGSLILRGINKISTKDIGIIVIGSLVFIIPLLIFTWLTLIGIIPPVFFEWLTRILEGLP